MEGEEVKEFLQTQLTKTTSVIYCALLAIYFVGSLYIWNIFPQLYRKSRNDKIIIKCRIVSGPIQISFFLFGHGTH